MDTNGRHIFSVGRTPFPDREEATSKCQAALEEPTRDVTTIDESDCYSVIGCAVVQDPYMLGKLIKKNLTCDLDAICFREVKEDGRVLELTPLAVAISVYSIDCLNTCVQLGARLERKFIDARGLSISPTKFAASLYPKTPLSRALGDWLRRHAACRRAALQLLFAHRSRQKKESKKSKSRLLPRDVFVHIGKIVWSSRNDICWRLHM